MLNLGGSADTMVQGALEQQGAIARAFPSPPLRQMLLAGIRSRRDRFPGFSVIDLRDSPQSASGDAPDATSSARLNLEADPPRHVGISYDSPGRACSRDLKALNFID
jgi:hypothetical protein